MPTIRVIVQKDVCGPRGTCTTVTLHDTTKVYKSKNLTTLHARLSRIMQLKYPRWDSITVKTV